MNRDAAVVHLRRLLNSTDATGLDRRGTTRVVGTLVDRGLARTLPDDGSDLWTYV